MNSVAVPPLPRSWARVSLKELGDWSGGSTPSKADPRFWSGGTIPWVSPKDMKVPVIRDAEDHVTGVAIDETNLRVMPPRSVLLVTRSGILQHTLPVAITEAAVALNQDLKALVPHSGIDPRYVARAIEVFAGEILRQCSKDGTTVSSIDFEKLLRYEIPLAPFGEQQRIVEAIESYFSRMDEAGGLLERVRRNLKRYQAAVLKAAVEGRLIPTEAELARAEGRDHEPADAVLKRILAERRLRWEYAERQRLMAVGRLPADDEWKAKYREPSPAQSRQPWVLPEGWCWASLEQIAADLPRSIQSGPFGSNLHHSEFQSKGTGRLVIGIDNVQDGHFTIGANHRIRDAKFRELQRYQARPSDVLITVMATIGRCCVVPEDIEPAIITKHVYRITVERQLVMPRFLLFSLLGSPVVREQILRGARGQTRPGLNGRIIKQLVIPLPPFAEQYRIVAETDRRLSLDENVTTAISYARLHANRLRQSVRRWAFEGRLVDQDPTDEPARALLERIRLETATATAAKDGSRRSARRRGRSTMGASREETAR